MLSFTIWDAAQMFQKLAIFCKHIGAEVARKQCVCRAQMRECAPHTHICTKVYLMCFICHYECAIRVAFGKKLDKWLIYW